MEDVTLPAGGCQQINSLDKFDLLDSLANGRPLSYSAILATRTADSRTGGIIHSAFLLRAAASKLVCVCFYHFIWRKCWDSETVNLLGYQYFCKWNWHQTLKNDAVSTAKFVGVICTPWSDTLSTSSQQTTTWEEDFWLHRRGCVPRRIWGSYWSF